MSPLRIAFMGTPEFAVPSLGAIHAAGHDIAAVYSQPPRLRGRGQTLQPSPVHAAAEALGLTVLTPPSMKAKEAIDAFRALDLDLAVVVAYGQILTREVLQAPRLGAFNLHGSLLPRWRGAAPIQRAIMAGDAVTGVQIMRMSVGLDEGPILFTAKTDIGPQDTSGALHQRLARLGAELWPAALQAIASGEAVETPQAGDGATYARKIMTEEARIDWTLPAVEIDRRVRGLSPYPGAYFLANTTKGPVRVKALSSVLAEGEGAPGKVLDAQMTIACGAGAVRLLRLQREGRAAGAAAEVARGLPILAGDRLA
jgi:methionyl-tRNA formyltransferase